VLSQVVIEGGSDVQDSQAEASSQASTRTSFIESGIDAVASAIAKLTGTMLRWIFMGAVLGGVVFFALKSTGALQLSWAIGDAILWLLLPCYIVAGAIFFGYIGIYRAIGGVVLHVAIERGYVPFLLDKLLGAMLSALRKKRASKEHKSKEHEAKDVELDESIPVEQVEEALKGSVNKLSTDGDGAVQSKGLRGRIMASMRRKLLSKTQDMVLSSLRSQAAKRVTLKRVSELVFGNVEGMFVDTIKSTMRRATLIGLALTSASFLSVPLLIWLAP